jgi:hypothetical protein
MPKDTLIFLWNGWPKPTFVQRAGAWLCGLYFIAIGLFLLYFFDRRDAATWLALPVSWAAIVLGLRACRNGVRRSAHDPEREERIQG